MATNPTGTPQPIGPGGARLSRRAVAQVFGRWQGPEKFFDQAFTALTNPIVPRPLNLTRPVESIKVVWRGRIVVATANISPVNAESPQTIIQRIRITGTHRAFNQLVPIDITGATAFAWCRLFQVRGSTLIINGARQPELTVPLTQTGATFGNIGTYDLEIHYDIPVTPMLGPHARYATIPFMWLPQDWGDSIQVQLFFGDATSFNGVPANTTFSAFGTGTGSPTASIFVNYGLLGPLAASVQAAVVVRNEFTTVGGVVAAIANAQRLFLLQKQKTTSVVFKSGIMATGASAGVQAYASLSDTELERTVILVDNKPVRNNQANFAAKEYAGRQFNTVLPGGYNLHTFIDSQNPLTYLRGDQMPGGAVFELDTDVLTANANNAVGVVQEMVFGEPRALAPSV